MFKQQILLLVRHGFQCNLKCAPFKKNYSGRRKNCVKKKINMAIHNSKEPNLIILF